MRAVWPGEHRRDKPIQLVEPPNTCLWDAQNQIRKAAFLSQFLEAFSSTKDELQALMVQTKISTSVG